MEFVVSPKKRVKHHRGWWLLLSVSFLLLLSSVGSAPEVSLSINGPDAILPNTQEIFTFEAYVSNVPIFSFPLEATLTTPIGDELELNTSDSFQGYKSTKVNFTTQGTYVIDASVSIGGVTQTAQKVVVVSLPDPVIGLSITSINATTLSGTVQTDTTANASLSIERNQDPVQSCTFSCVAPSCIFSCDINSQVSDLLSVSLELGSSSTNTVISQLDFQERGNFFSNISSLDFTEGENNTFLLDESSVTLVALNLNTSNTYVPIFQNNQYSFQSLVKGSYLLYAYREINGSFIVDSLSFTVQSSPNVISINPKQKNVVYSPYDDALYLRTSINVESANPTKPILIEESKYFDAVYLLRDKFSTKLAKKDGFFVVPQDLLSSVLEVEIKLSSSPYNPSPLLPDAKPSIQSISSFGVKEFVVTTNATQSFRYVFSDVSSFSFLWDKVEDRFVKDYFYAPNNSLIVYSSSKDILLLPSTFSLEETRSINNMFFISAPLEYDAKVDITLPLTDTIIESAVVFDKNGLSQELSFEGTTLFTSQLDDFEYVLLLDLQRNNVSGSYAIPIQFIPSNALSISTPKDISVYSGESATVSFAISNKLDKTALLDIIFNEELVSLSSAEYEIIDNNKNGFLDTGILVPGDSLVLTATIDVPADLDVGTTIPLSFKFSSADEDIIRTVTLIVEKKSFEQGKKINFFDVDLFDVDFDGENVVVSVRNNNLVDELVVLDVSIVADENRYQRTLPLRLPADGVVSQKIPVSGEKIYANAKVYFENGLIDTVPTNNQREFIYNDAWLDASRTYRVRIPFSEKYGYQYDIFNLRSFIEFNQEIDTDTLRAIVPTYSSGVFNYIDVPFRLLLYDEELHEAHVMIGVPDIHPNEKKNVYVYFDEGPVQNESLPFKQSIVDWNFETIIDNRDEKVSTVGSWFESTSTKGYFGLDYLYDLNLGKGSKFVVVSPDLPESNYELYITSPYDGSFASNVPVNILHKQGTTNLNINQKVALSDWKYLGLYGFDENSQIILGTQNTDGFVVFDAVKIIPVAQYIQESTLQNYYEFFNIPKIDEIENITLENKTDLNVSLVTNISSNISTNISLNDSLLSNISLNISINQSVNLTNISINSSLSPQINISNQSNIIISPLLGAIYYNESAQIYLLLNKSINYSVSLVNYANNETTQWNISNQSIFNSVVDQDGVYTLSISSYVVESNQSLSNASLLELVTFTVSLLRIENISLSVVSVNGSDTLTSLAEVILIHTGEYVEEIRFSCDESSWSQWKNWSPITRNFFITDSTMGCSSDQGLKTVHAEFKNVFEVKKISASIYFNSTLLNETSLPVNDSLVNLTLNQTLNQTNVTNKSSSNVSVKVSYGEVELGKPVEWVIEAPQAKEIELPKEAFNISAQDEQNTIDKKIVVVEINDSQIPLEEFEKLSEAESARTELAKIRKEKEEGNIFQKLDILGKENAVERKVNEISQLEEKTNINQTKNVTLKINSTVNVSKVTFLTPPPAVEEKNISRKRKQVVIESNLPYKNITSWTTIKETPKDQVKFYWYIDGERTDVTNRADIALKKIDTNNNGLIDRLEWITPHLSTQVFEIEIIVLDSMDIVDSVQREGKLWFVTAQTSGTQNLTLQSARGMYPSQLYCGSFNEFNASLTQQDLDTIIQSYAYGVPENVSFDSETETSGLFSQIIDQPVSWSCENDTIITYVIDVLDIFSFNTSITYGKETHFISTDDTLYYNLEVSLNNTQLEDSSSKTVDVAISSFIEEMPVEMDELEINLYSIDDFKTQRVIVNPGYEYIFTIYKDRNLYKKVEIKAKINDSTQTRTILLQPSDINHNFMIGENIEFSVADVQSVVVFDDDHRVTTDFTTSLDGGKLILSSNGRAIQPGRYQIEIIHSDYTEYLWFTYGLVSINTHKPLYHIGDEAIISMVVLDKDGFVVTDSEVELRTTSPSGKVFLQTTQNSQIQVVDNVYRTQLLLDEEGTYYFEVIAQTLDGQVSISSFVNTQESYPIDILRDVPFTFDPWVEPYTNNFSFVEFNSVGEFTFTETLPASFLLLDVDGAQVEYLDDVTTLTWTGLTADDTVSYTAQPPLITPYLYELGNAKLSYTDQNGDEQIFYENRSWILAIDPVSEGTAFQFYGQVYSTFTDPKYYPVTPSTGAQGAVSDTGYSSASTGIYWIEAARHPFKTEVIVVWQDDDDDVHGAVFDGSSWGNTVDFTTNTGTNYKAMDVAYSTSSGLGMVVYGDGSNIPKYRTWNGSTWSSETSASNVGGQPVFMRLVASPIISSEEMILATADSGSDVNVQEWDGSSFGSVTELTANCWSNSFCFDVAYETSTGDALAAYRGGTASSIYYNTYNNVSGWSGQSTVGGLNGDIRVIQMDSHPTTDWILAGIVDDNSQDFNGFMWTGSGWTDMGTFSTSVNYENTMDFDVAFNKVTGDGYVLYGEGSNVRYRTIPNGSTTESGESTIGSMSYTMANIRLESAEFQDAMYASFSTIYWDIGFGYWNGSSWDFTGLAIGGGTGTAERYYRLLATTEYYETVAPTSNSKGLNVSNGANLVRTNDILAYSQWSNAFRGSLSSPAYISHTGTGTNTNYTIATSGTWANYTFDLSNSTQFNKVGRVDVNNIFATDLGDYGTTGYIGWFFIYDYANLTGLTISSTTVNQNELFNIACQTYDVDLASTITDYTVFLYRNGSFVASDKSNATGWSEFSTSVAVPGTYQYNCSISNNGYYYAISGENVLSTTVTVRDSTAPSITLLDEADGYQTTSWPVWSNFSVTDTYSGIENCSIYYYDDTNTLVSQINFSTPSEGVELGYNLSLPTYEDITWYVGCYDDSINNNYKQSANRTFSVVNDTTGPSIQLLTPPNLATTDENVTFTFNATDVLSGVTNCSLYYDGLLNTTNTSVVEGEVMSVTLNNLDPGAHGWFVRCYDDSINTNLRTSSVYSFTVGTDTVGPDITVIAPANLTTDTDGDVNFTYIPNDFQSDVANCSLYIESVLNQTDTTITDGVQTGINVSSMSEGTYHWFLSCTDDSAQTNNKNTSLYTLYVNYDFDAPNVTLVSPLNLFQSISGDIDFIYNVSDESAIDNCSLLINGTVNQTNTTITKNTNQSFSLTSIPTGDYNWSVICYDASDAHYATTGTTRNFSVGPDTIGPSITLVGPLNDSVDTDGDIAFSYTALDVTSGIDQCEVFVNDSSVDVDNSVTESIVQFLTGTLGEGSYEWYINCTDDSPQANVDQSETWYFNVSIKYTTNYTVSLDNHYVAAGEIESPEIIFYDSFGGPLSSAPSYLFAVRNLGTDNQTLPWWNDTWQRRIEIPVTSSNEDYEFGVVNLSIDTATLISDGLLNSDCSDLRFADQGNNELYYQFYDADQACNDANSLVAVQMNNQWENVEHNIGVYFNNSGASAPSEYRDDYFVIDNFEGEDTFSNGYWTYGSVTAGGTVTQYSNAARASDGTNSSRLDVDCSGNTVCEYTQDSTSFSRTIVTEAPLNLSWDWRLETASTGTLRFYLDGVQQYTYTSATYATRSVEVPAGSHTIKWQYDIQTGTDTNFYAYVDKINIKSQNTVTGSATTQSEPVEELTSKTTNVAGEATFTWNTTGYSYGNYSLTGYATKDAYWSDNGYYTVYIGPDIEAPTYTQWGLNVTNGETVYRGDLVNASALWVDKILLNTALLEHNGTGTDTNYTVSNFGGLKTQRASYVLNTSNQTEFPRLGRVYVNTMYANDSSNNFNFTAPVKYFDLYSYAIINRSYASNTSRYDNETLEYTCTVLDDFNNSPIANYPVRFYFNGSYRGLNHTNSSGQAIFTYDNLIVGIQPADCRVFNNASMYYFAGTPSSNITYINVTDTIAPEVDLISPSNNSVRTTIYIGFSVRPTDDTLSSCSLYGDWGSGWSVKETRSDFFSGFINFFNVQTLYNGQHQWYVRCSDTGGNINTSDIWTFNVSVPAPDITLQSPADEIAYANPVNQTFSYYVEDDVDIDNCSIRIGGSINYTNTSVTVNSTNYFYVELPTYDQYDWTVECYNNQSIIGVTGTRQIYVMSWSMTEPLDNDQVDRDNLSPTIGNTINISATDAGGSSSINVTFYANLTSPYISGNNNLQLGSNLTNSSGTSLLLNFDPGVSYYPGAYEIWANTSDYSFTTINTTTLQIVAALDLLFSGSQNPKSTYNWSDNITVIADTNVLGNVNDTLLDGNYSLIYRVTAYAPSLSQNLTFNLTFNGSDWLYSFNTTQMNEIGNWNFSLNATVNYHYLNISSSRTVAVIDGIPPSLSLVEPANNTYMLTNTTNFNITLIEYFPDSCDLYGNWSGWGSKETISAANGSNSFSDVTLTDGIYAWDAWCNDTSSNEAWSSNGNFTFTVDTIEPVIELISPVNASLQSVGSITLYYNVSELDTVDNCSLYVNGVLNQTNSSITKNTPQNFTTTVTYGDYNWSVSCTTTHLQTGSSEQRIFYVPYLAVSTPANGTSYDRDGQLAYPDIISFQANVSSAVANLNISFYINNSGTPVLVGSNLTAASGVADYYYNPPGGITPGNITWWATLENTSTNSTSFGDFLLYGAYRITFESASSHPNNIYRYGENITISGLVSSFGAESYATMDGTYGGTINATFYAPRTNVTSLERNLTFNSSSWIITFNSSTYFTSHGTWNVSLNGTVSSSYFELVSLNSTTFFYNVTGYGLPYITLNTPLNDSTIFYDNPSSSSTNITFNWTVIDSLDASLLCNLTIAGVLNESNIPSNNNTLTLQNVSFSSGGIFNWSVTCSDYANVNTSSLYDFKIVPPDANISGRNYTLTGSNPVLFERVNFTANYSNFYNEPIVGTCSINFSDGISDFMSYNSSTFIYEYNRTMTTQGVVTWNVSCNHAYYYNRTTTNYVLDVKKAQLSISAPSNGTLIDRDETNGAVNDVTNIQGSIPYAPSGESINFYAQRLDPSAGEVYLLGVNTTNSSGEVQFYFNPNASIRAGNYTLYANNSRINASAIANAVLMGSLSIDFASFNDTPPSYYNRNTTGFFHFNITSYGIENATDLDTYYLNDSAYVYAVSPSLSVSLNASLSFYQNDEFNGTILFNETAELGNWNISGNISDTYFFEVSVNDRLLNITKLAANLTAWDQYDAAGGYVPAYVGENISFFANYTDINGVFITLDSCNFSFSDGSSLNATVNVGSQLHEVTSKLFFAPGFYTWNVTCTNNLYEEETHTDSIRIYPKTNTSVYKTINSVVADTMAIALNLTNYASYSDLIEAYDFIHYTEYADYNYSYGPNETNAVNSGEYVGNATKFNITVPNDSSIEISYYLNGSGDYNVSDLYIVGV